MFGHYTVSCFRKNKTSIPYYMYINYQNNVKTANNNVSFKLIEKILACISESHHDVNHVVAEHL